jgi:hypothetical protein
VVSETLIAGGRKWTKLDTPLFWHPAPGDVLTGVFAGMSEGRGSFGAYRLAVLIESPSGIAYRCSGTVLVNTLDVNLIEAGTALRVVYKGTKVSSTGYSYKSFDVYRCEAEQRVQTA